MKFRDAYALAAESLKLHRLRTGLTLAGIAIGVTAVIMLTALGDAAKAYVVREFAGIGTNLVVAMPGRTETTGVPTAGGTTRDLTLEDAEAIRTRARAVRRLAPLSMGAGEFSFGGRTRNVFVAGTTADFATVRNIKMASGQFLPPGDPRQGGSVVVIGQTIAREVFPGENPVGKSIRISQWRLRVIGVMAPRGRSLGLDFDDFAMVPVATGLRMFNQSSLLRVMCEATDAESIEPLIGQIKSILIERHDGFEDFTIITQDALLQTFRSIIDAITIGLAGIAAISLAVAGIGIMNVMLVSVSERTSEVGLMKAIGARRRQIVTVFLLEAILLSVLGAIAGSLLGVAAVLAGARIWPDFPLAPSVQWLAIVLVLALAAGAAFGLMPARRAARLEPADALRASK